MTEEDKSMEKLKAAADEFQHALNSRMDQNPVGQAANTLAEISCDLTDDWLGTNPAGCKIIRDVVANRNKGPAK